MIVLPTLTINGFVSDNNLMMVKIYEYFLTTQHSQSTIYTSHMESYDKIVKGNVTVSKGVENDISAALFRLYSNYFDNVEPTVELISHDENNASVYKLGIDITCTSKDGEQLYLTRSLTMTSNGISELNDVLDYFKSED